MDDEQRFYRTVDICSGVLSMGMMIAGKKGVFGGLKPTRDQIGWSIGFCDGAAQGLDLDDTETIALTTLVFGNVFGRAGPKHVRSFLDDQGAFQASMIDGGTAFIEWGRSGKNPLPPMGF